MAEDAQRVGEIVRQNPNLQRAVSSSARAGGVGAMNTARASRALTPRAERALTGAADRRSSCGRCSSAFPGFRTFVSLPPALQIGGRQGNSSYSVTLQSADTDAALRWAGEFERRWRGCRKRAGRLERPGDQEPARRPGDRSRQGGGGRPRRRRDRERALRRLRAAVVVDDLRRRGAVPRAAGARPEVPGARRLAEEHRVQDAARRAGAARRRWCSCKETSARRPSTIRASCRRCRSRSACGPASRSARRSTDRAARRRAAAADGDDWLRRVGEGLPGVDAQPRACCSSSPSASSTSCSACSTRATSIR